MPFSGVTSGSFVANFAETDANQWYRIRLTVRDPAGLEHTVFRDVNPRTEQFTISPSNPDQPTAARLPEAVTFFTKQNRAGGRL
jgi:hypothetical protein